ncbi:MAG: prolipoprotein diacylglyceryl transferase family protein [Polyangiaceae bacterium]
MAYLVFISLGIVLGALARRIAPEPEPPFKEALRLLAVIGAVSGAVIFQMPADFFGWSAGLAGEPIVMRAFGGRTLVGGLLGGWIVVEIGKWALGVRRSTGDGFALPLAVGLACGRMGCFFTGCCAGRPAEAGSWWSGLAMRDAHGIARFPAQLTEVAFHAACAALLYVGWRRGALGSRRFALYVAGYAAFRFAIEAVRENPRLALGLSYYQWLSLPLFALSFGMFAVRTLRPKAATPAPAATAEPPPREER